MIGALLVALAVLLARWSGLAGLTLAVTALILLTSAQQAWRQSAGPVAELAAAGAVAQVRGQVLAEPIPISGEAPASRRGQTGRGNDAVGGTGADSPGGPP